jgi:pimeloyl-ACP methyl ester carboxylesterase
MTRSDSGVRFLEHPHGRIAYRDVGQGQPVVFVHGTPTSSLEYVGLMRRLGGRYRCIAIDHLGFGASAKPPDGDYSIEAHTSRLRWLLAELSIDSCHLVVHDFGGVIGLPLAIEEPSGVRSVSIINSWAWPLIETEPQMQSQVWLLRSGLMKWLYLHWNFSPKVLLQLAWGKYRPLTEDQHAVYQRAFTSPNERHGLVAFRDALLDFSQPCWHRKAEISKLSRLPIYLAWGMEDSLISPRTLDRWISMFPSAKVSRFAKVGHFVAEEGEELLGPELELFWRSAG